MQSLQLSFKKCAEVLFLIGLCSYVLAYTLSAGSQIYLLITLAWSTTLIALVWLFISISVGKYLISTFLRVTRATLALPFRTIRSIPNAIRLLCFEAPVVLVFFLWFRALVFFDRHILRRALYWFGGFRHPSGVRVSSVNAVSPSFTPIVHIGRKTSKDFDIQVGISLANLSKLAYEDEDIIAYELKQAGFDLKHFKTISYHNTTGYVCFYKGVIVISFRGTEPLNLMHIMTDLQGGLVSLTSLDDTSEVIDAGKAHYGFLEALRLHRGDSPKSSTKQDTHKVAETLSLHDDDTIGSAFTALFKIAGFLVRSFARKPMTLTLPRRNGKITAFEQIQRILSDVEGEHKIERIYCTGHSLGGALATVYFAQAQLSSMKKSLVAKIVVYSFGAPRIGDARLKTWMKETDADKRIYKIVNAQDLVPRMPTLPESLPKSLRHFPYADSPGTLVHLNPLSQNSSSLEETPGLFLHENGSVPPIEFWGLSGLLSLDTIRKVRSERWLWIAARLYIPFIMFDHLASQYAMVLQEIYDGSDDGRCEVQMQL